MMSGSGPSVFGIFNNLDDANKALEAIAKKGISAFVCHKNSFWSNTNQK
jgi:4-diphosphocytidyl-2C-methyl-D-erythritol kinase